MALAQALLAGIAQGAEMARRKKQAILDEADRIMREELQKAQLGQMGLESQLTQAKLRPLTPGTPEYDAEQKRIAAETAETEARTKTLLSKPGEKEAQERRMRLKNAANAFLSASGEKQAMTQGQALALSAMTGELTPEEKTAFAEEMRQAAPQKVKVGQAGRMAVPYAAPPSMQEFLTALTPGAQAAQADLAARRQLQRDRIEVEKQKAKNQADNVARMIEGDEFRKQYLTDKMKAQGIMNAFRREMENKKYALSERKEARIARQGERRLGMEERRLGIAEEHLQIDWARLSNEDKRILASHSDKLTTYKRSLIDKARRREETLRFNQSKLKEAETNLSLLPKTANQEGDQDYGTYIQLRGEIEGRKEQIGAIEAELYGEKDKDGKIVAPGMRQDIESIDEVLGQIGRVQISNPQGGRSRSRQMHIGGPAIVPPPINPPGSLTDPYNYQQLSVRPARPAAPQAPPGKKTKKLLRRSKIGGQTFNLYEIGK